MIYFIFIIVVSVDSEKAQKATVECKKQGMNASRSELYTNGEMSTRAYSPATASLNALGKFTAYSVPRLSQSLPRICIYMRMYVCVSSIKYKREREVDRKKNGKKGKKKRRKKKTGKK